MHVHTAKELKGNYFLMPMVIKPKFSSTPKCPVPKYMSCELAHAKKHSFQVVQKQAIKEKEDILALYKYQVGDLVSLDQFVINTPGPLLTGYAQEGDNNLFYDGTTFNDVTTGAIWVKNQLSLAADVTVMAKI